MSLPSSVLPTNLERLHRLSLSFARKVFTRYACAAPPRAAKELPRVLFACRRLVREKLNGFKFAGVVMGGGVFFVGALYFNAPSPTISGKVCADNTQEPICDAMVAVESSIPNSDDTFGSYVKTDAEGRFLAEVKGKTISIRAWKPGYAMKGIGLEDADTERELAIALRKMTPTNWVVQHDRFLKLKPGDGFSFSSGEMVSGDSPEADIVIRINPDHQTAAIIDARGEGGIIFQALDDDTDFSNTPKAPPSGYQPSSSFDPTRTGFYFVRTRDGKHYAKFWLNSNLIPPPDGGASPTFDPDSRLIWAYQPDGTRNLEIVPTKEMFPFYKFGLKSPLVTARTSSSDLP